MLKYNGAILKINNNENAIGYVNTGYYTTLLWSGSAIAQNAAMNLSQHPSAFDDIRIECYGVSQGNNTIQPNVIQIPYDAISATNRQYFELPFFGATATTGMTVGWYFGGIITGTSSQNWKLVSAWGKQMNKTNYEMRFDFTQIREIWGVKYG